MGNWELNFYDNYIYIRKYRNRFHIWYEQHEQDWVTFFKQAYEGDYTQDPEPKKLIIWEE